YSAGEGLNAGSKLVVAVAGPKRRSLGTTVPPGDLPDGFADVRVALPGVLAVSAPKHPGLPADGGYEPRFAAFCDWLGGRPGLDGFPLVVLVDDAAFAASS